MLKNEYFLADAIGVMVEHGAKLKVLPVTDWEDTGTRDAILHTNRYLLRKRRATRRPRPMCRAARLIVPPVFLGAGRVTLEHSVIGPYASVGAGSDASPNSVVRDSIIGDKARVRAAVLTGSILIGDRARGPGRLPAG